MGEVVERYRNRRRRHRWLHQFHSYRSGALAAAVTGNPDVAVWAVPAGAVAGASADDAVRQVRRLCTVRVLDGSGQEVCRFGTHPPRDDVSYRRWLDHGVSDAMMPSELGRSKFFTVRSTGPRGHPSR